MASSLKYDEDNTSLDLALLPDTPIILDNVNDDVFKEPQTLNNDTFFINAPSWNVDTPQFDPSLFSASLSWDPPPTRLVSSQDITRPVYTSTMNTLTPSQQERLRRIAMPDHQTRNRRSPDSATGSSTYKSGSLSSPDGRDNRRKRKASRVEGEGEEQDDDGNDQHPPVKKAAHNMIEKRYRTNLNDKIAALRDSVPSLRVVSKSKGEGGGGGGGGKEDLQGLTPAHKLNKGTVLAKATEYIRHLEKRNARLSEENASMMARIAAFEKLFLSGSMGVNPTPPVPSFYGSDPYNPSSNGQSTPGISPNGMIEVPEDIRRMNAQAMINSQIYAPQENSSPRTKPQPSSTNGWNGGGYFGKMMVGSLAGLMILEGFSEAEQEVDTPNARGLFALPTQLLRILSRQLHSTTSINVLGFHSSSTDTLGFIKFMIVIVTLVWVFVPSLFTSKSKSKSYKINSGDLKAAPSLASSIAVRRRAWLTAIQTVWVPQHNFLLEVAALFLKIIKLSLRNVIGWYCFSILTGITDQQEAARIKAWSIALDSQLAGGDIEVNKTRLALTLLASETLPDTPARLMLKALHVKILLWELANTGFCGIYIFHGIAAKLARRKWNEARQMQQMINHINSGSTNLEDVETIPDHLVALLGQESDDIFVDSICQRAYNLTFNLHSNHNAVGPSDGMDSIVDDVAVRSPLDAVSAWYSALFLQRAFVTSLRNDNFTEKKYSAIRKDVDVAIKTAPIGSGAQVRALVARAVLVNERRGAGIASAMQILSNATNGKDDPALTLVNATTSIAALPDLCMSINCAVVIAHLSRPGIPSEVTYTLVNAVRPARLSLLGFSSAFKLMETIDAHPEASVACSRMLENLAGTLRIWIGKGGRGARNVPKKTREQVVERCLGITKKLVGLGLEKDLGYESMSEAEVGESS